jgi:hypothetical protein
MLPAIELECPYWPESADVVAAVQAQFGVRGVVLRLLESDPARKAGGCVTYLAEVEAKPECEVSPIPEVLRIRAERKDERRMAWAELGGPGMSLDWAQLMLAPSGRRAFRAVQQRTWNLSTLWRLEAQAPCSSLWLKQVPSFMNESRVLRWLNRVVPGAAPVLVAADDEGRSLLEHIAGEDLYGAPVATRRRIGERLHDVQRVAAEAVDELIALGVPDRRGERAAVDAAEKLSAWSPDYPGLAELLQQYARHLRLLDDAGLPATLVHGDMHPGNARGSERAVTLLDWGEVVVGDPATDILRLVDDLPPNEAAPLIEDWCSWWKELAPRSKPELALAAAPYVAAMRGAATYAHFLQRIEETEWPYHQSDVPRCLATAATLLG